MVKTEELERVLFTREEIETRIRELGQEINGQYGDSPVVLISVLKGSVPFTAALMKELDMDVYLDFICASSYGNGTESAGHLTITKDIGIDITGMDVLVVEDIVDTGFTLTKIKEMLKGRGAKSVRIASMLSKPERRRVPIDVDFLGFEIPDEFVIGFGLDYAEKYRNLPVIGVLARHAYEK